MLVFCNQRAYSVGNVRPGLLKVVDRDSRIVGTVLDQHQEAVLDESAYAEEKGDSNPVASLAEEEPSLAIADDGRGQIIDTLSELLSLALAASALDAAGQLRESREILLKTENVLCLERNRQVSILSILHCGRGQGHDAAPRRSLCQEAGARAHAHLGLLSSARSRGERKGREGKGSARTLLLHCCVHTGTRAK